MSKSDKDHYGEEAFSHLPLNYGEQIAKSNQEQRIENLEFVLSRLLKTWNAMAPKRPKVSPAFASALADAKKELESK